jgi:hypothetical protein
MSERREPAHALAQGELERRHLREVRAQVQALQGRTLAVEGVIPLAEAVSKYHGPTGCAKRAERGVGV